VGVSELDKAKAREQAKATASRKAWEDLKGRVFAEITVNAGQGVGDIKNAIVGGGQKITDAIAALQEEGLIHVEQSGRAKKIYPVTQDDSERYSHESDGD